MQVMGMRLVGEPIQNLEKELEYIPINHTYYSIAGNLREKTFANFVDLGPSVKVFSTKKRRVLNGFLAYYTIQHVHKLWVCLSRYPVGGESTKVIFVKSHISLIRESFLPRTIPAIR